MPLERSKSPAAFGRNVAVEERAGKPPAQAVAIAYSEKRAAGGKDPGYGHGHRMKQHGEGKPYPEKP